ncbi:ATP-binding protein [Sporosarcina psychrophila]|uniref:AlbA family DNA-binding domain-containing protein n=1 Tax=Sporosarcina psychrophila TaxID=1476 RepID=UPI0030D232CC
MLTGNIFNEDFLSAFNEEEKKFDRMQLKSIIDNSIGESNELDFKEQLIKEDKIAKIILAMANSGSGSVIFGISDVGEPTGLLKEDIKDTTDFQRKINLYLPSHISYRLQEIVLRENDVYGELSNKTFIVLQVPKQYRYVPYLAKKDSESVKVNQIYLRKNASIETATNEDLEELFKLRILEQYEDLSNINLEDHIAQLKTLYGSIKKNKSGYNNDEFSKVIANLSSIFTQTNSEHYPEEEFDAFIANIIRKKKRKIEIVLEVTNID